jgi:hypothetical protein
MKKLSCIVDSCLICGTQLWSLKISHFEAERGFSFQQKITDTKGHGINPWPFYFGDKERSHVIF